MSTPRGRTRPFLAAGLVFVALAGLWLAQAETDGDSWGEFSRLAEVESLVERGTFQIDASAFAELTLDKVFIDGHYYSDKPPLLPVLAAVPYWVLRNAFGLALSPAPCGTGFACARLWLTWLCVGVPSAAAIAGFVLWSLRRGFSLARVLTVASLVVFGSWVWPYSLVFNNHVPAAAALLGCLLLILPADGPEGRRRGIAAGVLCGVAVAFELVAVFPAAALAALTLRRPRRAVAFALGALVPIGIALAADVQISGSPLPPYFAPHGYVFPGSPFKDAAGGLREARTLPELTKYTFDGMVGERGLLAHSPVLLLALAGLVGCLRDRKPPLFAAALAVGLGSLSFVAYIFTQTDHHGGKSVGVRWLVAILPILGFFGLYALRGASRLVTLFALALTAPLSIGSGFQNAARVWTVTPPILYMRGPVRLKLCSSLADPERPCWPRPPRAQKRKGRAAGR